MKKWGYFILIIPLFSFSQQILSGKITNEIDHDGINVFNKTHSKYTISDANGNFKIQARVKDTIVFSALQYELKEIIVTNKLLNEQPVQVFLTTKINQLNTVYLGGYILTGNLSKDAKNIKTKELLGFKFTRGFGKGIGQYSSQSLRVDRQSAVTNEALGTSFEGVNIMPLLLKLLPKKKKKLKNEKYMLTSNRLISIYGEDVFTASLNLQTEDIERFVQFCENDTLVKNTVNENKPLALLERLEYLRTLFKSTE